MSQPHHVIHELHLTGGTQYRELNPETVDEYATAMERGDKFPPIKIVRHGGLLYVVDGFHRVAALKKLGRQVVPVEEVRGNLADAQWAAAGANIGHGLPRTNRDKRLAVEMALTARPHATDRELAKHCGVSDRLVADIRTTKYANGSDLSSSRSQPRTKVIDAAIEDPGLWDLTNVELGKRLGVHSQTVAAVRKEHGRSPSRATARGAAKAVVSRDLLENGITSETQKARAARLCVSQATVSGELTKYRADPEAYLAANAETETEPQEPEPLAEAAVPEPPKPVRRRRPSKVVLTDDLNGSTLAEALLEHFPSDVVISAARCVLEQTASSEAA